jgi:hypothetical protein
MAGTLVTIKGKGFGAVDPHYHKVELLYRDAESVISVTEQVGSGIMLTQGGKLLDDNTLGKWKYIVLGECEVILLEPNEIQCRAPDLRQSESR